MFWNANVPGAIYGGLRRLHVGGQITKVPYDPSAKVDTWWDLGVGDSTSICLHRRLAGLFM